MKRISVIPRCALIACFAIALVRIADGQAPEEGAPPQDKTAEAPVVEKTILAPIPHDSSQDSSALCKCIGDTANALKIDRVLRAPVHSNGLDFAGQPLQDVVNQLQEEYGIPIIFDKQALDAIGVRADEPVSVSVRNVTLKAGLHLMLKSLQLTYALQSEVLLITTPDEAEKLVVTCVYDVRDLATTHTPANSAAGASAHADCKPLVDAITQCIAKATWTENGGGDAQIRTLQPGMLVISQTTPIHEQIRELLTAIRTMNGADLSQSPRAEQKSAAASAPSPDEVVTRSYLLQLNEGDRDAMRLQVRELITNALPEEVWTGRLPDGQGVALTVFQDRVVIRQRPSVQQKVAKVLGDSGVARPAPVNPSDGGQPFEGPGGAFGSPGGMMPGGVPAAPPAGSPFGAGGGFGGRATPLPAPGAAPADSPFN